MFGDRDAWLSQERMKELQKEAEHYRLVREALRARKEQALTPGVPVTGAPGTMTLGFSAAWSSLGAASRVGARLLSQVLSGAGQRLVRAGSWLEDRSCDPALCEGGCE